MVSKLPQEFRRYLRNRNHLKHVLEETQRTLQVINLENFFPEGMYKFLNFAKIKIKFYLNILLQKMLWRNYYLP